jgi:hypothetical protein
LSRGPLSLSLHPSITEIRAHIGVTSSKRSRKACVLGRVRANRLVPPSPRCVRMTVSPNRLTSFFGPVAHLTIGWVPLDGRLTDGKSTASQPGVTPLRWDWSAATVVPPAVAPIRNGHVSVTLPSVSEGESR